MTATPRALSTCRTVLCTAEPAPALSSGRLFWITVEPGAATVPMATPKARNSASRTHTGVDRVVRATTQRVATMPSIPVVITAREPYRSTSAALLGAATS